MLGLDGCVQSVGELGHPVGAWTDAAFVACVGMLYLSASHSLICIHVRMNMGVLMNSSRGFVCCAVGSCSRMHVGGLRGLAIHAGTGQY